jgi:hypothetical protein
MTFRFFADKVANAVVDGMFREDPPLGKIVAHPTEWVFWSVLRTLPIQLCYTAFSKAYKFPEKI